MSLKVEFGNGATAQQFKLQEGSEGYAGDSRALNGGSVSESPTGSGTVGSELPSQPVEVSKVFVPNGGSGNGGTVTIAESTDGSFDFSSSGWNAVKNVKAVADTAQNVQFTDFVHVDVDFSAVATAGSTIQIDNVKRGNVMTGGGADTVLVSLSTNANLYQNTFNVSSGAGGDTIKFSVGAVVGGATITNGSLTTVTIDAGSGNDTIDLSGLNLKQATITGGTGNDNMTGSNGVDIYQYNAVAGGNSGVDTISGFQVGVDKFQFDGSGLGIKAVAVDITGQNTDVLLTDNTLIKLLGVNNFTAGTIGV